jgi:hypothetical protein
MHNPSLSRDLRAWCLEIQRINYQIEFFASIAVVLACLAVLGWREQRRKHNKAWRALYIIYSFSLLACFLNS